MKLINLTTIAAIVALPFAFSQAGEVCYPSAKDCKVPCCCDPFGYVFAYGGYALEYDANLTEPGIVYDLDYEGGFIVGAGAGIYSDLFCGTRFEIEGLFTQSDFDANVGEIPTGFGGDTSTYAVMVNALKEIPLPICGITGYAGAGVGYAWTDVTIDGAGSDEDGAFAYQLIVGGELPVMDCVALFAQYKLLGIGDTEYTINGNTGGVDDHFIHSVSAGIRVSF